MRSQKYVFSFVGVMTVLVALILAGMNTGLKSIHDKNEELYTKKGILTAIESELGAPVKSMSSEKIEDIFNNDIKQIVIDAEGHVVEGQLAQDIDLAKEKKKSLQDRKYPIYIYKDKVYILSVRGSGLWDAIWGSIALDSDLNTVLGVAFDHAGETPGLGAEIKDNPAFPAQFSGKKIFGENGSYTGLDVVKGGVKNPRNQVDAISGATITCNGVDEMLKSDLANYLPYLNQLQN